MPFLSDSSPFEDDRASARDLNRTAGAESAGAASVPIQAESREPKAEQPDVYRLFGTTA